MDYVINSFNGEGIIGTFYEKELRKSINESWKKSIKEKEINYMSNGKDI